MSSRCSMRRTMLARETHRRRSCRCRGRPLTCGPTLRRPQPPARRPCSSTIRRSSRGLLYALPRPRWWRRPAGVRGLAVWAVSFFSPSFSFQISSPSALNIPLSRSQLTSQTTFSRTHSGCRLPRGPWPAGGRAAGERAAEDAARLYAERLRLPRGHRAVRAGQPALALVRAQLALPHSGSQDTKEAQKRCRPRAVRLSFWGGRDVASRREEKGDEAEEAVSMLASPKSSQRGWATRPSRRPTARAAAGCLWRCGRSRRARC